MRREPKAAETALWRLLRDRQLEGLKFRRHVTLGGYIVDFLCLRHRVTVEADGPPHEENEAYDAQRDAWLRGQGFRVLRFANAVIAARPNDVLDSILKAARPAAQSAVDPSSAGFADTFSRKGRRGT